jgi:PAS domain S-box-containing protein
MPNSETPDGIKDTDSDLCFALQQGDALRLQAKARLEQQEEADESFSEEGRKRLIQELRIYQAELEIQNEALRDQQHQLEAAREHYSRLYHDAPVGYVTLDGQAQIVKVNSAAARLAGKAPSQLIGGVFTSLLTDVDARLFQGRWRAFYRQPDGKRMQLSVVSAQGQERIIQLTGVKQHDVPVQEGDSDGEASYVLLATLEDIPI